MFAKGKNRKAFTLVESLVAATILSGSVVAICAVSTQSLRSVRLNRDYEMAWDLLDRQLTLIDSTGVEEFDEMGQTSGTFDEMPGWEKYSWEVLITAQESDYLYRVYIMVAWPDGNRLRQVSLMTMFNGYGALEEMEGDPQQQGQGQS
jgi:hypothetical protein